MARFDTDAVSDHSENKTAGAGQSGVTEFPAELSRFFTQEQGRVLLVRGDPGAGKTLFAVQALDVLRQYGGDVLYVSTRVDTDTVYSNYLQETTGLTRSNVLDISQTPTEADIAPAEALGTDRFDPETFLEWLQAVGDVSGPLTIAFDSWELVERHLLSKAHQDNPIDPERLVTRMSTLARSNGIRVVLITENPEQTGLDYVVDGVVKLSVNHSAGGRPERTLLFEKLRGVRIGNRTRPFTLSGETFRVFTPVDLPGPQGPIGASEWLPIDDSKSTFSTGIADLDAMLGGGYSRGSVVHLELGPDLSRDAWSLLCFATARNFLSHDMCVAVVPLPESSPGLTRHNLEPALPDTEFETRCDVFETYDHEHSTVDTEADDPGETARAAPADDAVGGFDYDDYLRRLVALREESNGPLLQIISMDAAGDVFSDIMSDHATYVALHNDLSILVTKPEGGKRTRSDQIADIHLCLERRGETAFLYGKNPVTPFLGFDMSATEGVLDVSLQEMV
ncbi:MAG: RecA-superfamily ATPase [halophilic archaeon J07HX64]|nr:MAG: RecA-superfamily ATPase [halophilic archaeon J07HX64]